MTRPTGNSYYVRTRGRIQGPLSLDKLKLLRARGQFGRASDVSLDGLVWSPASAFPELFDPLEPAAAQSAAESRSNLDEEFLANVETRPSRSAARRARPAIWILAVCLLLGSVSLTAVLIRASRLGEAPSAPAPSPVASHPIGRIDLAANGAELDAAIGLVVCGWLVELGDGTHKEIITSRGTCFCIGQEGQLLTNKHVVETTFKELRSSAARQSIAEVLKTALNWRVEDVTPKVWVFIEHRRLSATIAHVSDSFDMAILAVDRPLSHYFPVCDKLDTQRGEEVLALGFPAAADAAKSVEEVAKRMVNDVILISPTTDTRIEKQLTEHAYDLTLTSGIVARPPYEDDRAHWIQHSAAISPGNSGGPLVLRDGRVVGINTLLATEGQGIFMALAMPQLREEIDAHVPGVIWK